MTGGPLVAALLFIPIICGAQTGSVTYRGMFRAPTVSAASFANSPRLSTLVRSGNLYLSLQDAIALAIENNLDVEFQRLNPRIADTDVLRAKGGGLLRGILTAVGETPAGIGGPGAPLQNSAATGFTANTILPGYASDLGLLSTGSTNSSILGVTPYAPGPAVPQFDPLLTGVLNYQKQSTPQTSLVTTGAPYLSTRTWLANAGYIQGFSPGTTISGTFNNSFTDTNSIRSIYSPYTTSSLGLTVTQPLLRGFGIRLNRRYIRLAENDERIAQLVFRQQLISTVSGVIRLYQDLVSLAEDVQVKRETLALSEKLLEDNRNKVDVGTLAPIEVVRAQAQVAASRQDLANSEGYLKQQELILKSVLTRRGTADPLVNGSRIVATDTITVPGTADVEPLDSLVKFASDNRPDLQYAGIQITNSEIFLRASKNELLPQLDVVGVALNSGLAGDPNSSYQTSAGAAPADLAFAGNYGDVLGQIARRNYPTYGIGLNLTLPLRNRVAQADVARDELQLRQSQIRLQQLANQIRLEVEDATVALERSRTAYEAAVETRKLQEQSVEIEQARYAEGLSTSFLVLQYQSFLAQARSTEIAARSTYAKARTALDRATGSTLERNHVVVEDALSGRVR